MAYTGFRNGFNIQTSAAIDRRILLSKAEMLTAEDVYELPDQYFAICTNDGKLYLYDVNREPNLETGKFVQIAEDLVEDLRTLLGAMAFADTGVGSVSSKTITGVQATGTPNGSLNVTVRDASEASEAILSTEDYTPTGSVTVELAGADQEGKVGVINSVATPGTLPSLGAATTGNFAIEGLVADVPNNSEYDGETLVLSSATISPAVITQGTFNQGAMPTFNSGNIQISSATFSGDTATDAIVSGVEYFKQEIDDADFTGSSSTFTVGDIVVPAENITVQPSNI